MGCPTTIVTVDDIYQLGAWYLFTFAVHNVLVNLNFDYEWYDTLRKKVTLPSQNAFMGALFCVVLANGYAVWRLWFCQNWDVYPVPLALYWVMVVLNGLWVTVMSALPQFKELIILGLVAFAALAMSVVFTVFAFLNDTWSGVIGAVADCAITVYFVIVTIQINMHKDELFNYKPLTESGTELPEEERSGKPIGANRSTAVGAGIATASPTSFSALGKNLRQR